MFIATNRGMRCWRTLVDKKEECEHSFFYTKNLHKKTSIITPLDVFSLVLGFGIVVLFAL